jgi:hypothetical protein
MRNRAYLLLAPADHGLMKRVLAESGVEQTPVPPETSYLGELYGAVLRAVTDAFFASARKLDLPMSVARAIAWGLAALAVLLIAWVVFSWWRRRRRGQHEEGEGSIAALDVPPARRTVAAWRAELDRRLAEGRIADALEALWWWLARSLAGDRAEPDWTSRDLVARARREDLRNDLPDLVRRLDAFTYGPRPPGVDDLRHLVGRLEEALA